MLELNSLDEVAHPEAKHASALGSEAPGRHAQKGYATPSRLRPSNDGRQVGPNRCQVSAPRLFGLGCPRNVIASARRILCCLGSSTFLLSLFSCIRLFSPPLAPRMWSYVCQPALVQGV